jgi:hypothetical protein
VGSYSSSGRETKRHNGEATFSVIKDPGQVTFLRYNSLTGNTGMPRSAIGKLDPLAAGNDSEIGNFSNLWLGFNEFAGPLSVGGGDGPCNIADLSRLYTMKPGNSALALNVRAFHSLEQRSLLLPVVSILAGLPGTTAQRAAQWKKVVAGGYIDLISVASRDKATLASDSYNGKLLSTAFIETPLRPAGRVPTLSIVLSSAPAQVVPVVHGTSATKLAISYAKRHGGISSVATGSANGGL